MWVKRTRQEQQEAAANSAKLKRANAAIVCMAFAALVTVGGTFFYSRLGSIQHGGAFLVPKSEILNQFPAALVLGIVLGGGMYLLSTYSKKPSKVVMICPKCEAAKDDDGNLDCPCGGHFVNIKTMKWVEEANPV